MKAADKYLEHKILNSFRVQQRLLERSTMSRDMIFSSLVMHNIDTIQIIEFNLIEICATVFEVYAV